MVIRHTGPWKKKDLRKLAQHLRTWLLSLDGQDIVIFYERGIREFATADSDVVHHEATNGQRVIIEVNRANGC